MRVGELIHELSKWPSYTVVCIECYGIDPDPAVVDVELRATHVAIVAREDPQWDLLPLEPTEEMVDLAQKETHVPPELARNVWHAMCRALSRD
jgi:hypothetical protein